MQILSIALLLSKQMEKRNYWAKLEQLLKVVHVLDSRRARPADPRDSNISSATVNKRRKK